MKRLLTLVAIGFAILLPTASEARGSGGHGSARASSGGSHSVRSYVKRDGTYVERTRATNPDRSKYNNYSSKPNVNPYSGKAGTRDPAR